LVFKTTSKGFFVGGQVLPIPSNDENSKFKPIMEFDNSLKLRFLLKIRDLNNLNYTNIKLKEDNGEVEPLIFYFSNKNNNVVEKSLTEKWLYLTKPIPEFRKEKSYEAGQLIVRSGKLLESIQEIEPGNNFLSSHWKNIYHSSDPFPQFASEEDRLSVRPKVFRHNVTTEDESYHQLDITLFDKDDLVLKKFHFEVDIPEKLIECYLDLRIYPIGIYSIIVENEEGIGIDSLNLKFYLDDVVFNERPFALIECYYEPNNGLGEYKWLDNNAENRIVNPSYHIRWKSRSTFWRFYFHESINFISSQVEALPAPDDNILQTLEPLALSQITRSVGISYNGDNLPKLLPNPSVTRLLPENGKVFSEIDMGGLFKK